MSATNVYLYSSQLTTANGNSSDLSVGNYVELAVDINVTGTQGTSPTIQFFVDRKGADGIYYQIWSSSSITASSFNSFSIGAGLSQNSSFGATVRFRWSIGGSSTPGFTYSASIIGK